MKKVLLSILLLIVFTYGILLIPDTSSINIESEGNSYPFVWNQDERWDELENLFTRANTEDPAIIAQQVEEKEQLIEALLNSLSESEFQANDPRLGGLLDNFFEIAPLIAVQNNQEKKLTDIYNRARRMIKDQSVNWDIEDLSTRNYLYKVLYGMRATVEEVLLQSDQEIDPVLYVKEEVSATPSTTILGIKVHSGDLLVSRGGAAVSALISRGNDFPGNFSHVALIYVEEGTNIPYLVEAHIERGVAIATLEEYIKDRKLRFMVLRPRADLPQILENPMLPHIAAKEIYEEVQQRHIPYDFKMNFFDPEAMFCSEVGSYTYKNNGIQLWQSESTISSYGVVTLLNTFGVENFVTQMPSDLEYDPQLSVVAEWRNSEALFDDHLYNAVIDAMLECADKGEEIEYNAFLLPVVRTLKGYSVIKNKMGSEGPVPEGMSATQALKSDAFIGRHEFLKEKTLEKAKLFEDNEGYTPPYWELVKLARESADCVANRN
ncbi:MAG: YiiX/YebB-like N1pC/P60 family cysteine hydrolase [Balneolaceae bacterium]